MSEFPVPGHILPDVIETLNEEEAALLIEQRLFEHEVREALRRTDEARD